MLRKGNILRLLLTAVMLPWLVSCGGDKPSAFEVFAFSENPCQADSTLAVCQSFDIDLTLMKAGPKDHEAALINQSLLQWVLGFETADGPQKAIEHFVEQKKATLTADSSFHCRMHLYPELAEEDIVSFVYNANADTYYRTYSTKTGRLIDEKALFQGDAWKDGLADMLNKSKPSLADTASADSAVAYTVAEIHPNNNFRITATGLIYHYNPGEIAPAAKGGVDIAVPSYQIDKLLNRDCEIFRYWFD